MKLVTETRNGSSFNPIIPKDLYVHVVRCYAVPLRTHVYILAQGKTHAIPVQSVVCAADHSGLEAVGKVYGDTCSTQGRPRADFAARPVKFSC